MTGLRVALCAVAAALGLGALALAHDVHVVAVHGRPRRRPFRDAPDERALGGRDVAPARRSPCGRSA